MDGCIGYYVSMPQPPPPPSIVSNRLTIILLYGHVSYKMCVCGCMFVSGYFKGMIHLRCSNILEINTMVFFTHISKVNQQ